MIITLTPNIVLANKCSTRYEIVEPATPSVIDKYAIRELAEYLNQISGATFPVVEPSKMTDGKSYIFVGDSEQARLRHGNRAFNHLTTQEWRVRVKNNDLLLIGQGLHGQLNAVFGFLRSIGWEWVSVYEHPVFLAQSQATIDLEDKAKGLQLVVERRLKKSTKPSFLYRNNTVNRGPEFFYQSSINMDYGRWKARRARLNGPISTEGLDFLQPIHREVEGFAHNLFDYIPPYGNVSQPSFNWVSAEQRNMFLANPSWFSQINGARVGNRQLNFGNRDLRAELTARIKQHIGMLGDGEILLWLSAMDTPGEFCQSKESKALEEQYGAPCGPIIDYLMELCNDLSVSFPHVTIRTLAYRKGQTQEPPNLPPGQKLPSNLIIDFAPIDDNYFGDWSMPDPEMQKTLSDLKGWSSIVYSSENLWCWMYPGPYGTGKNMPVGNIEKIATQMRIMKQNGVSGCFLDHNGFSTREQFAELQQYVAFRMMENVNANVKSVIKTGADALYGAASKLIQTYLSELESERKSMQLPRGVRYASDEYDDSTFPYLTVANIHRWQGYFDQAEILMIGHSASQSSNVKRARRELDYATLLQWQKLKKAYPAYYTDHLAVSERITALESLPNLENTSWEKSKKTLIDRTPAKETTFAREDFITLIEVADLPHKPLPEPFATSPNRVERLIPKYAWRQPGPTVVRDEEAWLGYGCPVHQPKSPFTFGFWDWIKYGTIATQTISLFPKSGYSIFDIGADVTLTPACNVWFSTESRVTHVNVGQLYEVASDNVWRIYASIKFNGPTYGSDADERLLPLKKRMHGKQNAHDLVLVDQVILVKV